MAARGFSARVGIKFRYAGDQCGLLTLQFRDGRPIIRQVSYVVLRAVIER